MKRKGSVLQNSIAYTVGNLLLKAFAFFLIPLYTSYLSTEAYGVINLANGFQAVAGILITFSLHYGVIRYYADYKNDPEKVARLFGSAISLVLMFGLVFSAISLLLREYVTKFFFEGIDFYPVVLLSILTSVVSALYTVYQDILKGMQEAKTSVILSYVYFFLLFGGNVITIVLLKWGANGALFSVFAVNLIMVVIMFVDLLRRKLLNLRIDPEMTRELLKYSVPLIPHTLAYNIQNYATKLIISSKLSLSVLGLFSLASQFGMISDVVLNSVQSAFQPWMFSALNEKNEGSLDNIRSKAYLMMWVYGLFFILIGVFGQEAVLIMAASEYVMAWKYIPALVLAIALKAPLYFYLNLMYYDKSKTKYVFVSSVLGSIVNVALTWALVPHLQVYGSIIADIIALVVRSIVTISIVWQTARKIYSLWKLELLSIMPMIFMAVALIPAFTKYQDAFSWINIAYKCVILLMYLFAFCLANRKVISQLLQGIRKRGQTK